jgi:hypothetical protein
MPTLKSTLVLALLASPAFASINVRPAADTVVRHVWFCTADGYDYNGTLRSISGGLKGSKGEAARDAVRACQGFYSGCRTASCFQEQ